MDSSAHSSTSFPPPAPPPQRRSYLSDAIGNRVVNPVLRVVDVDGIIRRVDVNDLLRRVDWDELFAEEIDMNAVLDQVDFDRLLQRIDVNRVLDRVDVDKIIERSNLKSIIARSTNGMCIHILNTLRAQIIRIDQITQRFGRCGCCPCSADARQWILPPKPTTSAIRRRKERRKDRTARQQMHCPTNPTDLAIAVQGRNAGVASRALAYGIDRALLVGIFAICLIVLSDIADLIVENERNNPEEKDGGTVIADSRPYYFPPYVPLLIYFLLGVIYDSCCLGTVGRTLGKLILGLIVVHSHDGKTLSVYQAIYRSVLNNIYPLVGLSGLISLIREDRRGVIDMLDQTTVVYAWDAHNFRLAEQELSKDMVPFGDLQSNTRLPSEDYEEDQSSVSTTTQSQKRKTNKIRDRRPVKTRVVRFPSKDYNGTGNGTGSSLTTGELSA